MLTGITLKNYTTFIKKRTFDFKATNYRILEDTNVGNNRVLKGALFVGENASGKTQVLDAISLLLNILLVNGEQNYSLKKSFYTEDKRFSLKYTFDIDGNDISYEITLDGKSIVSESLLVNKQIKLDRIKNAGNTYYAEDNKGIEVDSQLSFIKQEYYNTRFNNDKVLNKWFDFLKDSIYINCLHKTVDCYNPSKYSEQVISKYADTHDAKYLNKVISSMNYNSEIIFNKDTISMDNENMKNNLKIEFKKKGTDVSIPLLLESAGNKAFVSIIIPMIFATKNDCMIIVDEFSSGLHNELEEALIRFFYNNSKNSQLFFTSHSTNLIDTGILRPDQIYSFRFDPKEGTCIKRFSEENPRESQNMEKMYLNGVFDGMPEYDKNFKV